MRPLSLFLALFVFAPLGRAAEPFEIKDGDHVLFLGDVLLEREGTYGYLETRMHEQFPERHFTVRNLSMSGDTPLGWSRASFDPPAAGFERLKEQLALVKPTVVFLGYGMAASLQELADRSGDITLNPDTVRYGAEPMSAGRFKKELGQCMDAINATDPATKVRFVLLSPIKHEDLRKTKPGLPDPAEHNKLLEQYCKALEELAKERGARFVNLAPLDANAAKRDVSKSPDHLTDNGIHLSAQGDRELAHWVGSDLVWWTDKEEEFKWRGDEAALRAAIIKKNELFFNRWRPENHTYLFGFRKHEQGQNGKEIPQFDPLIDAAEAGIDQLKRNPPKTEAAPVAVTQKAGAPAAPDTLPLPQFDLDPALEMTLWAENPFLEKPTEMNWDATGRLWVCSSGLYPQIAPGEPATDRIIIIEDTDHDGKADKGTVFADGLLIPTGVESDPSPDGKLGCYVGQSTELLHFRDTDGDGKADERRVVLSGFGTEDTHHILHTLRWGPDGRLYFDQSIYIHSHLETPWGMVRMNSGAVMAYDPRTERVEVLFKGFCNPWGHAWDKWGQEFVTDGAGFQGVSWGILGAQYFTYENGRNILQSVSPGNYPKFASLELIQSPHFPADWQGNAITCDFRAHRIVRFQINDLATGENPKSGYVTKEMPDVCRTGDVSFRPIDVKLGPDGALYVADWSNPVINHGEVDFRDPRRDHTHGRIWRISVKGKAGEKWEPMGEKKTAELLDKLRSESLWEKTQAGRTLYSAATHPDEKLRTAVMERFSQMEQSLFSPETAGLATAIDGEFFKLFIGLQAAQASPDYRVRSAAVRWWNGVREKVIKERREEDSQTMELVRQLQDLQTKATEKPKKAKELVPQIEKIVSEIKKRGVECPVGEIDPARFAAVVASADPAPRVRVEAMRALSRDPSPNSATLVLKAALIAPEGDPYYAYAASLSINELAPAWTNAIASGVWVADSPEKEKQLAWGLAAIRPDLASVTVAKLVAANKVPLDGSGPWIELVGQSGGPQELDRLWKAANEKSPAVARILGVLGEAARTRNARPTLPTDPLATHLASDQPEVTRAAARLAGAWKFAPAVPRLLAFTGGKDDATRNFAFDALREIGDEPARAGLRQLAAAPNPPPIRGQAVVALAALDLTNALPLALEALAAQPSEDAALAVWRGLLAGKDSPDRFAGALPKDLPKPVASAALRAARERGKAGEKLVAALAPMPSVAAAPRDVKAEIKRFSEMAKTNGHPIDGEAIYHRIGCVQCHSIGGAGGKFGPDFTSLGASAPLDYIVESLFDPTSKVKEGFIAFAFTMKDGSQMNGIPTRETATEQFIRVGPGPEIPLVKANIVKRDSVGSMMPAGLIDALSDNEKLDLISFLSQVGKPGPFDATKSNVARIWWLFPSSVLASAVTPGGDAPAVIANVDGALPKQRLADTLPLVTNAGDGPKAATKFQLATAGKVKLNLTGIREAWLDGQGLAVASEPSPTVDLPAGVHTLAVRLDPKALPETIRVQSAEVRFLTE